MLKINARLFWKINKHIIYQGVLGVWGEFSFLISEKKLVKKLLESNNEFDENQIRVYRKTKQGVFPWAYFTEQHPIVCDAIKIWVEENAIQYIKRLPIWNKLGAPTDINFISYDVVEE